MNLVTVSKCIIDRLLGDTYAGGLFDPSINLVSGVFDSWVNPNQLMPYIVFNLSSEKQMDAFNADITHIQYYFHVYVSKTGNENCFYQAAAILDRLRGNALDTTAYATTPFGLHRWQMTTLTGLGTGSTPSGDFTGTAWMRVDGQTAHEEDYLHYIELYETYITKTRQA